MLEIRLQIVSKSRAKIIVTVGYYLWRFLALTETFIQREVCALQAAGVKLQVFADAAEDSNLLDASARELERATCYLLPLDPDRLAQYRRHFLGGDPFSYADFVRSALPWYRTDKSVQE